MKVSAKFRPVSAYTWPMDTLVPIKVPRSCKKIKLEKRKVFVEEAENITEVSFPSKLCRLPQDKQRGGKPGYTQYEEQF